MVHHRSRRHLPAVFALLVVLLGAWPAVATPAVDHRWPVPGPPVRDFEAPSGPYGPGHRGVDLAADAGQPVRPTAPGTVRWAGTVAGERWATVVHADGVATSYGPLRPGGAPTGTVLGADDVLGTAAGTAHASDGGPSGRLHLGARVDGRYVDPATLVSAAVPMVATLVGPGAVAADPVGAPRGRVVLVPGTPPSPNHLLVLAGLTTSSGPASDPFDLDALGYGPDHASRFSYAGVDEDGTPLPYDAQDTWARVHDLATALEAQLRAHAAAHPGQAVDLAGHSLGGLVAMYYLLVLHDPTDPGLPPIGRVATVASPLGGADSATAGALLRDGAVSRVLLGLVTAHLVPELSLDMPVLDDLVPGSEVTRALEAAWARYREDPWSSPLALGTDVLTIGSVTDPVVNEHRSDLGDAPHERVLDADVVHAHADVTRDPRTEELLLAFLSGEPLPDGGGRDRLADLVGPTASRLLAGLELLLAIPVAGL